MAEEKKYLTQINKIYKETNELYHIAAKKLGLSDCAFWVLYFLQAAESNLTQSALCSQLYEPKQTVHSALKKLEREGYICFQQGNDRRTKYICLTESGTRLAESTIDQVIEAEIAAFCQMDDREKETFIALFTKYTELLKESIEVLDKRNEGGIHNGC